MGTRSREGEGRVRVVATTEGKGVTKGEGRGWKRVSEESEGR